MKRTRTAEDQELRMDLHRAGLAMTLAHFRRETGLSQAELAEKAAISQQQLSKLEKGDNCNMVTFLRVCEAMDLELICVRRRASEDSQAGRV